MAETKEKSAYQRGWEDGVWAAMNTVELQGYEAGLELINAPPPEDPQPPKPEGS